MSASGASDRSPSLEIISHVRTGPPPFNTLSDFVIRTAQNTSYHVSSSILSFASPHFRDLLRNRRDPYVLDVPESDAQVETLLRLTYPIPDPVLNDLDDVTDAYIAARKYQLAAAEHALQRMLSLPRFMERDPLRVYALARRFDLDDEANAAALLACRMPPQEWPHCEEFEHISAAQYHDLVRLHRRRGQAATQLLHAESLSGSCSECGKQWEKKYRKQAARVLLEAPTSDRAFSNSFVAKLARDLDCMECSHSMLQAIRPHGSISKLKAKVDALPIQVISDPLTESSVYSS